MLMLMLMFMLMLTHHAWQRMSAALPEYSSLRVLMRARAAETVGVITYT